MKKSPLKIGIVWFGSGSGAAHITYELAKSLSKLHNCVIFLSNKGHDIRPWQNVTGKVVSTDTHGKDILSAIFSPITMTRKAKSIARKISNENLDVVIEPMGSLMTPLVQRHINSDIRWVSAIHDPTPHPDRWLIPTYMYRKIFKIRRDIVIATSQYTYELLKEVYPDTPIILKRQGYYLDQNFHLSTRLTTLEQGASKLLFFGRIEHYKGIDVLIDAFTNAKTRKDFLSLTIVGKGPISKTQASKIETAGIQLLNNYVSDEEIISLLDSHHILVLPYLSATQSGPAYVSIGRCMPCIASDAGALPEQILDGQNGVIVAAGSVADLTNAILKIAGDKRLPIAMAKAAHKIKTSGDYTWDSIAEKLINDIGEHIKLPTSQEP